MANYNITAPDGTKYQVTAPDDASQADVMARVQAQHQPTQVAPEEPSLLSKLASGANAAVSATMFPGTSAISSLAQKLPQSSNPAIAWLQNKIAQGPLSNIGEATNAVSSIPTQVLTNKVNDINRIQASPLFGKRPADYGAQSNAALQAGADVVGGLAPMLITPEAEAPKAAALLEKTPFQTARELNLVIPPSYAQLKGAQTTISPTVEGLVGAPKAAVEASVKNAPAINSAVAKDLPSFEKGAEFSDENLDEAAKPYYDKYTKTKALGKNIPIDSQFKDGVSSIGQESSDAFPMDSSPQLDKLKQAYLQPDSFGSNGAVLKIRQLRSDAGLNISSRDPERMQLGYAQRKIATLIEDQMDRYASSRPEGFDNPNLISDFRDARTQIAKIETARDARLPGTTDISPARLFRMKNNGNVPLSGNMDKIADLYGNFKPALQDAAPLRNKTAYNRFEGAIGAGGTVLSVAQKNPGIFLKTMGLLAAPPLARKALLSAPFQNAMLPGATNPFLYGLKNPLLTGAITQGNK